MSNFNYFRLFALLSTVLVSSQLLCQEKPYLTKSKELDFGELLGFTGSCHLDFITKELTDNGGSLCPFSDQRYGEPAHYIIVANPGSQVEFRIISYSNPTEGLSYIPEGIYEVNGLPDVTIVANQFQTIDSGDTGVISIFIGGTLSTSRAQSFNSSFLIEIEDGISFNEVP